MLRSVVRMDPLPDLRSLSETVDRLLEAPLVRGGASNPLPLDVFEREGDLVVRAALPGVKPEDLNLQIENHVLTIQGSHKFDEQYRDAKVYRQEHLYGEFSRSVRLPQNLDVDKVDASFDYGIVTVTIPKLPEEKPAAKRIAIRAGGREEQGKQLIEGSTSQNAEGAQPSGS